MTKANQRKLLILLAVVFWMAIIFKLSAQPRRTIEHPEHKSNDAHRQSGKAFPT